MVHWLNILVFTISINGLSIAFQLARVNEEGIQRIINFCLQFDPSNAPHHGGGMWAGGSGGYNTAGLGGAGGPFRFHLSSFDQNENG